MDDADLLSTAPAILSDGTAVTIRPLCPEDAEGLQDLVRRLSPESRYLRFLGARCTLLPDEALQMASIDYHSRMGYVAITRPAGAEEDDAGTVIGTACYTVRAGEPDIADFAVMVEDRCQGLGLGTHLLLRLAAYACTQGLSRLAAVVHAQNARMLRCAQRTGLAGQPAWEDGMWAVSLDVGRMAAG